MEVTRRARVEAFNDSIVLCIVPKDVPLPDVDVMNDCAAIVVPEDHPDLERILELFSGKVDQLIRLRGGRTE